MIQPVLDRRLETPPRFRLKPYAIVPIYAGEQTFVHTTRWTTYEDDGRHARVVRKGL